MAAVGQPANQPAPATATGEPPRYVAPAVKPVQPAACDLFTRIFAAVKRCFAIAR